MLNGQLYGSETLMPVLAEILMPIFRTLVFLRYVTSPIPGYVITFCPMVRIIGENFRQK